MTGEDPDVNNMGYGDIDHDPVLDSVLDQYATSEDDIGEYSDMSLDNYAVVTYNWLEDNQS